MGFLIPLALDAFTDVAAGGAADAAADAGADVAADSGTDVAADAGGDGGGGASRFRPSFGRPKFPKHTAPEDLDMEAVRDALRGRIAELRAAGDEQGTIDAERVLAELD